MRFIIQSHIVHIEYPYISLHDESIYQNRYDYNPCIHIILIIRAHYTFNLLTGKTNLSNTSEVLTTKEMNFTHIGASGKQVQLQQAYSIDI